MKKIRTKWWHLLVFLPVVILLPVVNCLVDPGEVFHSSSRAMAKYWLQGNDVAFTNDNGDIRQFKKYVITGGGRHRTFRLHNRRPQPVNDDTGQDSR